MSNGHGELSEFGKCRLDAGMKILWCEEKPVQIPLKAVELLCVLVGRGGEVVTKDEIWRDVWQDAFVEETNLTHNIYLLRKTFKNLGEKDLIQTVPRRGYRFTGKLREIQNGELFIEKRTQTRTLIEIEEETPGHGDAETPKYKDKFKSETKPRRVSASVSLGVAVVVVLVSLVAGFPVWRYQNPPVGSSAGGIKSIAVLPFNTIDAGKDNEHHGLGLADVLITRLSNIKEIIVRPTSAIVSYEDQRLDSIGFGEKLQVDAVLEGTIYRTNNKVRVTARLIKVVDSSSIWSGQFEKPLQDELRLQDEIALQLVNALALNLSGDEKEALTKLYSENADAYQLYLKGRYEWNKRSYVGMTEAQRLFRNAIDKDPDFALAYVGLADTIATGSDVYEASIVVQKALELDPNLAEAHASLGFIEMFHHRQWREAENSFKKSIELSPNYQKAHHWFATLLAIQGKNDEAKVEMQRAIEINPLSYNFLADLGQIHYFAREYDEAKVYCNKALEIYPDFSFAHQYLYYVYLKTGEYDKAIEEIIAADRINFTLAGESTERGHQREVVFDGYGKAYRQGGVKRYLEFRFTGKPVEVGSFYFFAIKHAFLGEKEKALDNLEKSSENRAFLSAFVKAEPIFDGLRDEPRFREVLRKMDLQ